MEDKGAEYPEDGAGGDGPGMWASRSPRGSGKVRVGNDELEEKLNRVCRAVHSPGRRKLAAGPGQRDGRKWLGGCAQEWPVL